VVTLASLKGGQPPIDPKSDLPENQTPAMTRFKQDPAAQKELSQTAMLADMKAEDFDTVFYVGGHGPMWDLAESTDSIALIESTIPASRWLWSAIRPVCFIELLTRALRL
jgi:putative intracellular protease/amidase